MPVDTFTYRPLFGRILTGFVVALCLVGMIGLAAAGDWSNFVRTVWPLLFAATVVTALFWRPRIDIAESGVTVVNVFRSLEVPWPAIERIDTRYAVTLFTPGMKISVWAAPSPGIRGATTISRSDVTNLSESAYGPGGTVRPGDSVSSPSGQVAYVLRRKWEEFRDSESPADEMPGAADAAVRVTHHRTMNVAVVLLAVATLISAVV